nr:MAG TPA: hypothetical protein [Caudoviricetes sp.]
MSADIPSDNPAEHPRTIRGNRHRHRHRHHYRIDTNVSILVRSRTHERVISLR